LSPSFIFIQFDRSASTAGGTIHYKFPPIEEIPLIIDYFTVQEILQARTAGNFQVVYFNHFIIGISLFQSNPQTGSASAISFDEKAENPGFVRDRCQSRQHRYAGLFGDLQIDICIDHFRGFPALKLL